jgi:glycosyltransferase involved in cell wall biosynthesis
VSTQLRILHVLRAPVGGLFRHVLDLAGEQAARGHAVGIVADATTGDSLTEGRLAAIAPALALGIARIAMARQPGPGDFAAYRAVRAHAAHLDVDVLHGHGAKGGAYARLARRSLRAGGRRIAAFYTPHGGSLNYRPGTLESRVFIGLEKMLDHMTDGLIFESVFASDVYRRLVTPRGAPFRIVPNGLQPRDFALHAPAADAAEFLFLGELRSVKGVDVLLQALARVNRHQPARAVIVGSGPEAAAMRGLATELSIADKTQFPGAMPAAVALSKGRCFVVPSRAESFPYVVLEAAAAAMPLISTNVGGIPEIVAGTDTFLIAPDDVDALERAMLDFLADPEAARARATRLRDAVATKLTVAAMTDAILAFYSERLAAADGRLGRAADTGAHPAGMVPAE